MSRVRRRIIQLFVMILDVLLLNFSNTVAFGLRFGSWPAYNWLAYQRLFPWESASLVLIFAVYGLYNYANKTSNEMKSSVVTAVIINGFVTLALTYLIGNIGYPRSIFVMSTLMQIPAYLVGHLLHRSYMLRTAPSVTVLIVGHSDEWPQLTVRAGQFLPRIAVRTVTPDTAVSPSQLEGIGAIVLGRMEKPQREAYLVAAMARSLPCLWAPDSYDVLVAGAEMTNLGDAPMFSLPTLKIRHGSALLKRWADILVASTGLVVGAPLYGLLALAIAIDSGRPIFYFQERVTVGGRVFQLVKFRSMIANAEEQTGPILSPGQEDPRITRFGRFLRTSHLDELPQLWNILRGDMSLVGPRPERPVFVEDFRNSIAHYDLRHLNTPGLTGLAQVAGTYQSSPEDKATYDVHYAKTWHWLRDLTIIIQTLFQWRNR